MSVGLEKTSLVKSNHCNHRQSGLFHHSPKSVHCHLLNKPQKNLSFPVTSIRHFNWMATEEPKAVKWL